MRLLISRKTDICAFVKQVLALALASAQAKVALIGSTSQSEQARPTGHRLCPNFVRAGLSQRAPRG
jgi:hypothetical protein